MTFSEAISQIRTFWQGDLPFPHGAGEKRLSELQSEFGMEFPAELQEYIRDIVSLESFTFDETVWGNPIEFYGAQRLGTEQEGYSFNGVTGEPIFDWSAQWFLFADESGDPVIIDLSEAPHNVQMAWHGMGVWDFDPKADSIAQFLLCSAAIHHALTKWGPDILIGDEHGFTLAEEPAGWLFPRMKEWAGTYYTDWCCLFDNR